MTPYKYLTKYRLSKVSELSLSTEKTIGSIALCVRFHQMSHFGKQFKENYITNYIGKFFLLSPAAKKHVKNSATGMASQTP
ncbi:MAG: hypothetical protein Q4F21_12485 [Lachnospiraceae bacterium]|nr:hypothetical protein [Lachnospiraceae bacterium]